MFFNFKWPYLKQDRAYPLDFEEALSTNEYLNKIGKIVEEIAATTATFEGKIDALDTKVNEMYSSVETLKSSVDSLQRSVTTINGKVSTLETKVNTINTNIQNLQTSVGNIETDLSALTARVTNIENNFPGMIVSSNKEVNYPELNTHEKTIVGAINECATLIVNPDIFYATYGVTLHSEILAAINEGRNVVVKKISDSSATTEADYYYLMRDVLIKSLGEDEKDLLFANIGWTQTSTEAQPYMFNTIRTARVNPLNEWSHYEKTI